jgi:glycerate kinase
LGRPVTATYGIVAGRQLAVIEMAAASGLGMIASADRDVFRATSFGTGELIRDALDRGARHVIVGIGGSATNDAGTGLFSALGVRFLDACGIRLAPGATALAGLAAIDASGLDARLSRCDFQIACDVDNPLLGPRGASTVFGPQKGADSPESVALLDAALARWADVVEPTVGRSVRDLCGAGAAGGVGAGLSAFLPHVALRRGVDIVADTVRLDDHLRGADLALTGEGSLDAQTLGGKAPMGVLDRAQAIGVPVIMFAGHVTDDCRVLLHQGVTALVSIVPPGQSLDVALRRGPRNLADAVTRTVRQLTIR